MSTGESRKVPSGPCAYLYNGIIPCSADEDDDVHGPAEPGCGDPFWHHNHKFKPKAGKRYMEVQVDRPDVEHFGKKGLVHVVPVGGTMYVTPEELKDDPTELVNLLADSLERCLPTVALEVGDEAVVGDRALVARARKEWPRPPTDEEREKEMLAREQVAEDMTPERPGGCD